MASRLKLKDNQAGGQGLVAQLDPEVKHAHRLHIDEYGGVFDRDLHRSGF
jgi:hypothetical protein